MDLSWWGSGIKSSPVTVFSINIFLFLSECRQAQCSCVLLAKNTTNKCSRISNATLDYSFSQLSEISLPFLKEMFLLNRTNTVTNELKSEAGMVYTRQETFKRKMITFCTTSSSHRIVDTSNHGSKPAQKVSSKRVLTPYQKSFFFR